jgi:hypothetical protein
MAHYALVHTITKKVLNVLVYSEEEVSNHPQAANLIQTSYNTKEGIHYTNGVPSADQSKALRKNYAGIGFTYDSERDAFIPPKPADSWVLNEEKCVYEAPIPIPADAFCAANPNGTVSYSWNEENQRWDNVGAPLPPADIEE